MVVEEEEEEGSRPRPLTGRERPLTGGIPLKPKLVSGTNSVPYKGGKKIEMCHMLLFASMQSDSERHPEVSDGHIQGPGENGGRSGVGEADQGKTSGQDAQRQDNSDCWRR